MGSNRWSVLAIVQGSQRPVASMAAPLSLGLAAGYRTNQGWILTGGIHAGLTESTSDLAVSVVWSRRLSGASASDRVGAPPRT